MNAEQYQAMKEAFIQAVRKEHIVISLPTKLVIKVPIGGYLRFNHMVMPQELLDSVPQMTIDMLHNKLIIGFGLEPEGESWVNLAQAITSNKRALIPVEAQEALGWLSGMIKIEEVLRDA